MEIPKELDRFRHYLVGDSRIDSQHLGLLKLLRSCSILTSSEYLLESTATAIRMWKVHSAYERNIMLLVGFPFLQAHSKEHDRLSDLFNQVYEKLLQPTQAPYAAYNPIANTFDEILSHIDLCDTQLSPYIAAYVKEHPNSSIRATRYENSTTNKA